jgi:2-keto-4-pentenoate hydratase/2-oxohepta-3-ene-1,7-dioic acid hydratase in catechol pathway
MRLCRFVRNGAASYGVIAGDEVTPCGNPFVADSPTPAVGSRFRLGDKAVRLLAPCEPTKVVAVGLNYRKHAEEMKKPLPPEPLLFTKPSTAVNGTGSPIVLPPDSQGVEHEAELALVIGRRLHDVSEAEAMRGVFGLTCLNDVTARDIQRREGQYTRAKGYDTFACVGPWIESELSPNDLRVICRVNGTVRQDGRTSDMIFSPARLVSFISRVMTLLPGDVITTGTPSGVGPLQHGDTVEVEVEGIGTLSNPVVRTT